MGKKQLVFILKNIHPVQIGKSTWILGPLVCIVINVHWSSWHIRTADILLHSEWQYAFCICLLLTVYLHKVTFMSKVNMRRSKWYDKIWIFTVQRVSFTFFMHQHNASLTSLPDVGMSIVQWILTLWLVMSYIYIYIWSTYSWCF